MFSVLAQCEVFFLESQACLPYLSGIGTEYTDQAENTAQTRQTNDTIGTVNNQRPGQWILCMISWKTVAVFDY